MFVLPRTKTFNFSKTGNLANGLNKISTNEIALFTTNQNRLHIDNIGRVGIGTTDPQYKLHIQGTLFVSDEMTVNNFTVNDNLTVKGTLNVQGDTTTIDSTTITVDDSLIRLADNNPNDMVDIGFYGMYVDGGVTKFTGVYRDASEKKMFFFAEDTIEPTHIHEIENPYLTIDTASGFVGVGLTQPAYVLDVDGAAQIKNDLVVQGDLFIKGASSDGFSDLGNIWALNNSGDTYHKQPADKNVSIGVTNNSGYKLEVHGDIGVSGAIVPLINEEFDLGASGMRFKDLYISGDTIFFGQSTLRIDSGKLSLDGGSVSGAEESQTTLDESSLSDITNSITAISFAANARLLIGSGNFVVDYSPTREETVAIITSSGGAATYISTDGINWTNYALTGETDDFQWVADIGLYCRTSGTDFQTSPDAITWTSRATIGENWAYSPDLGQFFSISGFSTTGYSSTDGISWSSFSVTVPGGKFFSGGQIQWAGGSIQKFIARELSSYMYSADGITWTLCSGIPSDSFRQLAYSPDIDAVFIVADNDVYKSTDGITFSGHVLDTIGDNNWNKLRWLPYAKLLVACGDTGTDRIYISRDGDTWMNASPASDGIIENIAARDVIDMPSVGKIIFGGESGVIYETVGTLSFEAVSFTTSQVTIKSSANVTGQKTSQLIFSNEINSVTNETASIYTQITNTSNNVGDLAIGISGIDRLKMEGAGDFTFSGPTGPLMKLTNDGKLGIGTDSFTVGTVYITKDQDDDTRLSLNNSNTDSNATVGLSMGGMGYTTYFENFSPNKSTSGAEVADGTLLWQSTGAAGGLGFACLSEDIKFYTGGSSTSNTNERMRILNGGNVGIGTDNPGTKLHIYNSTNAVNNLLRLQNANSGTGAYTQLQLNNDDAAILVLNAFSTGYTTSGSAIADGARVRSTSSAGGGLALDSNLGSMTFWTNSTERMRILNGGNVGIGTNNPNSKFQVWSDAEEIAMFKRNDTSTPAVINIENSTSSSSRLRLGYDQSGIVDNILAAQVIASGVDLELAPRTSSAGGIKLYTNPGTAAVETMTLSSAGNVGIGTNNPNGTLSVGDNFLNVYPTEQVVTIGGTLHSKGGGVNTRTPLHVISSADWYVGTSHSVAIPNVHAVFGDPTAADETDNSIVILSGHATPASNDANPGVIFANQDANSNLDYNSILGKIAGFANSDGSGGISPGGVRLYTSSDGSTLTERMRIDSTGNLGIGDSTPGSRLHIKQSADSGSGGIYLEQSGNANNYRIYSSSNNLIFSYNNAVTCLTLNSNGNITPANDVSIGNNSLTFGGGAGGSKIEGNSGNSGQIRMFDSSGNQRLSVTTSGISISGALSKSSGSFIIPHPDPVKAEQNMRLKHCFVESPTAGDNIYRLDCQASQDGETVEVELPNYYKFLNNNTDIWVNGVEHFGRAYGKISEDETKLLITCEKAGKYKVLCIGTRKDIAAVENFSTGVEYISEEI